MPQLSEPLDFRRLRVYPLAERRSLAKLDEIMIDPAAAPEPCDEVVESAIARCAAQIRAARQRGASVMLIYGAHLIKNGAASLLGRLIDGGWVTHLATNGAGTIHDWEFAWFGKSTESVADGVGRGCFGTWDETGRNIHLALLAGGIRGEGYGRSLGRFISEDGITLPAVDDLRRDLKENPDHPMTPARADLLRAMLEHNLKPGRHAIEHPYKHGSALSLAFQKGVPVTVHPGIGYDIIANHPMFNGAVIGRAADVDFRVFGAAVEGLDGGVVLSIGSAIMGPQVFEKSLSCVNNLRLQAGRPIVSGHSITVVDLQDGGNWDWTQGEPPKTNPAYYLRFCKSYSRMGGEMHYVQADNAQFTLRLCQALA
jgi:hypothetical protein